MPTLQADDEEVIIGLDGDDDDSRPDDQDGDAVPDRELKTNWKQFAKCGLKRGTLGAKLGQAWGAAIGAFSCLLDKDATEF